MKVDLVASATTGAKLGMYWCGRIVLAMFGTWAGLVALPSDAFPQTSLGVQPAAISGVGAAGERCEVSGLPDNAVTVLTGVYSSRVPSSVSVSDNYLPTYYTRLRISDGSEPIVAIVTSYRRMIWSVEGASDRLAKLIVHNLLKTGASGQSAGGVIGLPAERVTFIGRGCLRNFSNATGLDAAMARGRASQVLGREIDRVIGSHSPNGVTLPEGAFFQLDRSLPPGLDGDIWRRYGQRFFRSGIMMVDADDVVSSGPAIPFEVLPSGAGLAQLVASGHIVEVRPRLFRIVRPITHLPFGLLMVVFLLEPGLPIPAGDLHDACILAADTGRRLAGTVPCILNP